MNVRRRAEEGAPALGSITCNDAEPLSELRVQDAVSQPVRGEGPGNEKVRRRRKREKKERIKRLSSPHSRRLLRNHLSCKGENESDSQNLLHYSETSRWRGDVLPGESQEGALVWRWAPPPRLLMRLSGRNQISCLSRLGGSFPDLGKETSDNRASVWEDGEKIQGDRLKSNQCKSWT